MTIGLLRRLTREDATGKSAGQGLPFRPNQPADSVGRTPEAPAKLSSTRAPSGSVRKVRQMAVSARQRGFTSGFNWYA